MLLPTKVSAKLVSDQGTIAGKDDDGVLSFVPFPCGTPSHWTAQPVLNWIESLATATSMVALSEDATVNSGRSEIVANDDTVLAELSKPTPTIVVNNADVLHHKRSSTPPLLDESSECTTCQWDLSFIDQHDPMAHVLTRKMKRLAGNFEQMMTTATTTKRFHDMSLAYQMVQSRFNFTFDRIVWQNRNLPQGGSHLPTGLSSEISQFGYAENRRLLDALYEEICQKLQNITSAFIKTSKGYGSIQGPTAVLSQPTSVKVPAPKHTDLSKSMNKHQTKQELGKYMTSWLRANFTNPYPDDEGLIQMANHCGTTNQVISNWLINARTRKWRPAIIKATELGRPSDMLLEDSMNIFDGKPVRRIGTKQTKTTPTVGKVASTTSNVPTMISPIRPDMPTSIVPSYTSSYCRTTERECHLERLPAAKRQKRLHVNTATSGFSTSSVQCITNRQCQPIHGSSAPNQFHRSNVVEMNTGNAPKLIFDDEDDDGILLQSIQNAIDLESMNAGTIKFDTDFFTSTNAADEETVDIEALSPTFFNIANLHEALSKYKF